ncbi:Asp23/Gls24 family envelope stress response protein [Lachnospiraceae bacterium C1.1]|nr:Asp23/Gls24 family envelope stress response protein [Lachnospiraceae bacterium C1.1]
MSEEIKSNGISIENDATGEIKIADDVVAAIASLAAQEVEGVGRMTGSISKTIMNYVGMRSVEKGVRVDVAEGVVRADISLNIKYGYSIPEVSKNVQKNVKSAIETMTGLSVADVNIRIASIDMGAESEK